MSASVARTPAQQTITPESAKPCSTPPSDALLPPTHTHKPQPQRNCKNAAIHQKHGTVAITSPLFQPDTGSIPRQADETVETIPSPCRLVHEARQRASPAIWYVRNAFGHTPSRARCSGSRVDRESDARLTRSSSRSNCPNRPPRIQLDVRQGRKTRTRLDRQETVENHKHHRTRRAGLSRRLYSHGETQAKRTLDSCL